MMFNNTTGNEPYLVQAEAAQILRLSERTLERMRVEGTGPRFVRAGRRVLYRRADIEAWAETRTFTRTSEADADGVGKVGGVAP